MLMYLHNSNTVIKYLSTSNYLVLKYKNQLELHFWIDIYNLENSILNEISMKAQGISNYLLWISTFLHFDKFLQCNSNWNPQKRLKFVSWLMLDCTSWSIPYK